MSTNQQIIEVVYKSDKARTDSRAYAAAEQKQTRETAAVAAKAAKEAGDAVKKALKEQVDAAIKAYKDETAAAQRSANDQAVIAAKLADSRTVVAREGLKEQTAAFKRALDEQARLENARHAEARIATTNLIAQQAREYDSRAKKQDAIQADAAKKSRARIQHIIDAMNREKQAAKEVGETVEKATGAFGNMALGMIGITSAAAGLGLVKEMWRNIADDAARAAAAAISFQKASRVSGTLTGKSAEQIAPEILTIMSESGLDQSAADELYRQFQGSLPAGKTMGNITDEVANDLLKHTAKTAARQGGDAGTRGDLAGILASYGKVESAQAGLGQLEAIRQALTEGRGDDTPLTKSLLNVAGTLVREGGPVGTLPELAALVGTASLAAGPTMADTRALQITRATRGTTKEQMAKIEQHFGIKQGSKMGLEERLDIILPKLSEIGKKEDVASWLTTNIGTPQEDSEALVQMMTYQKVLKSRFTAARAGANAGGGAAVMAANAEHLASPLGRDMLGKAKGTVAEYNRGQRDSSAAALVSQFEALEKAQDPSIGKSFEEASYRVFSLGATGRAEGKAGEYLNKLIEDNALEDKAGWVAIDDRVSSLQSKIDILKNAGIDPFKRVDEEVKSTIDVPLAELVKIQREHLELAKRRDGPAGPAPGVGGVPPPQPGPRAVVPGRVN